MSIRPTHFEYYTSDPAASTRFFEQAFGWTIEQWGDRPYWLVTTGQGAGIDGAIAPAEKEPPYTMNTMDVDDLDIAIKAATEAGGTLVGEVTDIPGVGRWTRVREPGGVVFGMMEPAPHDHPH